jgi:hypothetical protein
LEEVLEHERILYSPEERLPKDFLEDLFKEKYKGEKSIGQSYLTSQQKYRFKILKKSV